MRTLIVCLLLAACTSEHAYAPSHVGSPWPSIITVGGQRMMEMPLETCTISMVRAGLSEASAKFHCYGGTGQPLGELGLDLITGGF